MRPMPKVAPMVSPHHVAENLSFWPDWAASTTRKAAASPTTGKNALFGPISTISVWRSKSAFGKGVDGAWAHRG